ALDAALDVFDSVDMAALESKSRSLAELFIAAVEAGCPCLALVTPRDPHLRGSQVSLRAEHGYAIMQALIARGVIGDFRAPDIIRFGFAPLYLNHVDVVTAAAVLGDIVRGRLWDDPRYTVRAKVT